MRCSARTSPPRPTDPAPRRCPRARWPPRSPGRAPHLRSQRVADPQLPGLPCRSRLKTQRRIPDHPALQEDRHPAHEPPRHRILPGQTGPDALLHLIARQRGMAQVLGDVRVTPVDEHRIQVGGPHRTQQASAGAPRPHPSDRVRRIEHVPQSTTSPRHHSAQNFWCRFRTSTATSLLRRTRAVGLATSAMAPLLRVAMANVRIVLDDHAW